MAFDGAPPRAGRTKAKKSADLTLESLPVAVRRSPHPETVVVDVERVGCRSRVRPHVDVRGHRNRDRVRGRRAAAAVRTDGGLRPTVNRKGELPRDAGAADLDCVP